AATAADHEGSGVVARDVRRSQAHIENPHQLERLLPEAARVDQIVVYQCSVVDEYVEPAVLALDLLEDGLHLSVIGMIASDGNSVPTEAIDFRGRFSERSRQGCVFQTAQALG